MPITRTIDDIIKKIESLSRLEVKHRLKHFRGFKLDFTDKYLDKQSISKLRHILLAAMTTTIRRL